MFQIEVSTCPSCGGRMRVVEIATEPDDVTRVLAELGLRARAPPQRSRPASPQQMKLPFTG